jgi:hypothetical protein
MTQWSPGIEEGECRKCGWYREWWGDIKIEWWSEPDYYYYINLFDGFQVGESI